ncbi:hypothetical protein [Brevibacillus fulvus]|uniref:Uncharacterized protein n=1 Tax=Brevibacillus fulvus TaxID=1125967 RepID=A0A938XTV5_9BACL|nr:hypothetical protein [Brevibacillus fulvus]MBM7590393.1 hypothetical protein [Brevibacillus fulvus]
MNSWKTLKQNLDTLVHNKLLDKKYIILFGANKTAEVMVNHLARKGVAIGGIIDNNKRMHGKDFLNTVISFPEELLGAFRDDAAVLIASMYYHEMKLQLESMGYTEGKHIFQVMDMNHHDVNFDLSEEAFKKAEEKVRKGYEIYQKIIDRYGEVSFFMCPKKPNGDVYILCSYLKTYLNKPDKLDLQQKPILLTVIGKSAASTASMFDIDYVEALSLEDSDNLAAFAKLFPEKVITLHPYFPHFHFYSYVDGYKGLNFIDEFKYGLFGLDENDKPYKPNIVNRAEELHKLFQENRLEPGNTVILAPYVNSLAQIDWRFWEVLAEELQKEKYVVCTNCTREETPIKGTIPLYFEFRDAIAVTEKAGYVVSYRSGFCEIIANSSCKKVVVYPDVMKRFSHVMQFFGMDEEIYRTENLIEVGNTFGAVDELVEYVMNHFRRR